MNKGTSFFNKWFLRLFTPTDTESFYLRKGEIFIVFVIGFAIALSLWMLVNMNKEYYIQIDVPVRVTDIDERMAFSQMPPNVISVGVYGDGWNLIPLYRKTPELSISVEEKEVDVTSFIESELALHTELTIYSIHPQVVSVKMEPKASKKIPVLPDLDIRLLSRYEILGGIRLIPDSITVTGAKSVIDTIHYWPTKPTTIEHGQGQMGVIVPLEPSRTILDTDYEEVRVSFYVTEFTEGEIRVPVRVRNVPEGERIRLEPSFITLRYDVSVDYFEEVQQQQPFEAFIEYQAIRADTTGLVAPVVRSTSPDLDIRIRSFQPRTNSYFKRIE